MTVPAVVLSVVFGALGFVSGLTFSSAFPKDVVHQTPEPKHYLVLVTPTGVAIGEAKPGLDTEKVLKALEKGGYHIQEKEPPKEKFFIPDRSGNNTF